MTSPFKAIQSDITRANIFFLSFSLSLSKVSTRTARAMKKSQRNVSEKAKGRRRVVGRNARSLKEEKIKATRIFAPVKKEEHKKKKINEDEDEVVEEDEDEQQKTTKKRKNATVVATGGRRSPLLHKFPPDGTAVPGPSALWYLFQFQKREEELERQMKEEKEKKKLGE